ncbi:MAG: DNA polymerase III subunit gamma/tau [Candidatus Omnitrophica bacterium]|nr:DNA polymerase III subunit gamma/tau [Candidatus Omnitrophota bacterium]
MEYQILALKWRPQSFDEIVGQDDIVKRLTNFILNNRVPQAFLFSGPHGVGKTSTARILAKSLNCKEGPTIKPCQKCSNCIEITESRNLDVIEIDGASNRGIDEIRALRENVKFPPTNSRYKIYIIDEVHMLTIEAFNALLKTLEEPPSFVKFIFATTQPHKILPTILSRCQRFCFKRIAASEIIKQLKRILYSQNIEIEEKLLFSIARASQGSLRDAESTLDQLISFKKDKISLEDVMAVLGVIDIEILFSITDRIISKDPKGIMRLLNKAMQEGKDLGEILSGLIEHFRNLLVVKVFKDDFSLLDLPLEICKRLQQQSLAFSIEEIMYFFNSLVNIKDMVKRIDSIIIPLEVGLIKLSQEKKEFSNGDIKDKEINNSSVVKEGIEEKKDISVKREIVKIKESKNEDPFHLVNNSISIEEIKNRWPEIIEALKKIKMSVASYLNEGTIQDFKDSILVISFAKNNSFHKEILEQKHNKVLLEKVIEDIFKTKIRLNFILSKEEVSHEENQSFIKSIIETFNARPINRDL